MTYVIAIDCGGTFTDCIVIDEHGKLTTGKAASTPLDYIEGILASLSDASRHLLLSCDELLEKATVFGHGTTIGTNALLARTGANTGLLTTRGHEDAIIIGRTKQKIAGLTDLEMGDFSRFDKADPIVPKWQIRGISERVDWKGDIVTPLSHAEVAAAVHAWVAQGVEAIAISFLWSFMNPLHEREARAFITKHYPEVFVTLSSDLAPILGEYERTATTAINAYVSQKTGAYLRMLEQRLYQSSFRHKAFVMQSSGGVTSIERACEQPVTLLASGPSGGLQAAAKLGQKLGYDHIITSDVGGTSFDVGLISDGEPEFADAPVLSKYQVANPMLDITSIGAGGGSIAWIETGTGVLKVGPHSAGACPGPVCYGMGGTMPTVTDANLVLGRINPEYFLGGQKHLDAAAAQSAIGQHIANPLGCSIEDASMGIINIADAHMADLVQRISFDRGHDPRQFILFAFGGAGPLHVGGYARRLHLKHVLVPAKAAEFSAYGIAIADVLSIKECSELVIEPFDPTAIARIFDRLEKDALHQLTENGISEQDIFFRRSVTARYRGQVQAVRASVPQGHVDEKTLCQTIEAFQKNYEQKYGPGTAYRRAGIEITSLRVQAFAPRPFPGNASTFNHAHKPLSKQTGRKVFFHETGGWQMTPVYRMEQFHVGDRLVGPAIIEAPDTTLLIHPDDGMEVDTYGNFLIQLAGGPEKEERG